MAARLLLALAVSAALAVPAAAGTKPTLALAATDTVVARGSAFRPRELVRVVLTVDGASTTVRVRATTGGRFTARFPRVVLDVCSDWRLAARGALGSRAVLLPRQSRDCPPPPPPG